MICVQVCARDHTVRRATTKKKKPVQSASRPVQTVITVAHYTIAAHTTRQDIKPSDLGNTKDTIQFEDCKASISNSKSACRTLLTPPNHAAIFPRHFIPQPPSYSFCSTHRYSYKSKHALHPFGTNDAHPPHSLLCLIKGERGKRGPMQTRSIPLPPLRTLKPCRPTTQTPPASHHRPSLRYFRAKSSHDRQARRQEAHRL